MTAKELLYIEDSLAHEQFFKDKCKEAANSLEDPELKSYACQLEKKHSKIFDTFYNLI